MDESDLNVTEWNTPSNDVTAYFSAHEQSMPGLEDEEDGRVNCDPSIDETDSFEGFESALDITILRSQRSSATEDPVADFLACEQENLTGLQDALDCEAKGTSESNGKGLTADVFDGDSNGLDSNGLDSNGLDSNDLDSKYDLEQKEHSPSPVSDNPELEAIRVWREKQQLMLQKKDQEEAEAIAQLRLTARKELEELYLKRSAKLSESKSKNRNAEEEWIAERDSMSTGLEWEKVALMCDFNPKASRNKKDTSRMKTILLQLKQSPPLKRTDE